MSNDKLIVIVGPTASGKSALAIELAKEFWNIFWQEPGKKFVPKPENLAKSHLGMFLKGKFSSIAFVGTEIGCGDGYVDLLVNFLGINYIVELKILGGSWGIGWSKEGLSQLARYMSIYETTESYLIVFDGRKTSKGEQLHNEYNLDNKIVHVISAKIYWE